MRTATKQKLVYLSHPRNNLTENERAFLVDYELILATVNRERSYAPREKRSMGSEKAIGEFHRDLDAMRRANEVHIFWKYPDADLLFNLGMTFALGKKIVVINEVERAPGKKSHNNVLLDLESGKKAFTDGVENNSHDFLNAKSAGGGSAFMICPVRDATPEIVEYLRNCKKTWEANGLEAYYPGDQTNQVDPEGGINICRQNLASMMKASGVAVFWTGSTGSLFDLGMAFALGKDIARVSSIKSENGKAVSEPVERTKKGSYENLMLKLLGDFEKKVADHRSAVPELLSCLRV